MFPPKESMSCVPPSFRFCLGTCEHPAVHSDAHPNPRGILRDIERFVTLKRPCTSHIIWSQKATHPWAHQGGVVVKSETCRRRKRERERESQCNRFDSVGNPWQSCDWYVLCMYYDNENQQDRCLIHSTAGLHKFPRAGLVKCIGRAAPSVCRD